MLDPQKGKDKVDKAKTALNDVRRNVEAIKQATVSFKAEADKAAKAATDLNGNVGENTVAQQENAAKVTSLAKEVLSATKTSHKSVTSLCEKVMQAEKATTNAEKLLTEAEGIAGSAADNVEEVITKKAKLAREEFEKLSAVLKELSGAQKCSEEAKKTLTNEVNAFYAMKSAEEALGFSNEITAQTLSTGIKDLKAAAKKATDLATAAVNGASAASNAADKATGNADTAVKSAELWLEEIEAALKALQNPQKKSDVSPEDSQSSSHQPSEPSQDEAHSQSLPPDPPSSTSTDEKPSGQQKAGTTMTDTEQSTSVPSEEKTVAESLENAASQAADAPPTPSKSDAQNTLSDAPSRDSSVSPPWVRTPLLLVVVGVLGLLAVC
ncbi:hypothetical protein DQ04_20511000 [Trypanosoma grayi]|uniref:hypothetical protein n=1 Tax=Trypanosoma grayi TaxID=71804 RepID=UPI0004F48A0E|nr:hypothetical protein DQ04_20511000 [Trypanosoma grayi]KEG05559.1 hypothetical protein DQ04_20511000 [Trypanosoma grayi]